MEEMIIKMKKIAYEDLSRGKVDRVIGFGKGDFIHDSNPLFISSSKDLDLLVWDPFCVNNLSKYLINELKNNQKIGIFLKGCDSLGFNQLVKDNKINPDNVIVYGVPCEGMIDPNKLSKKNLLRELKHIKRVGEKLILVTKQGEKEVIAKDFEYDKCLKCKHPNPVFYSELLESKTLRNSIVSDDFEEVMEIEDMNSEERFEYWSEQFSKCIRCYACRNICPVCSCDKCIFDNLDAGVSGKAKVDSEDQFFHIVRAYHVAGRCVDCGECSRVCPEGIAIDNLNRKIIKDITEIYGEYDAGLNPSKSSVLVNYELEDFDPFETSKGGKQ